MYLLIDSEKVFEIANLPLTIGRDEVNGLQINDPSVSREHFQISKTKDGRYCINDLNSSGGTYLNGHLLKPETFFELKPEDKIICGETTLIFTDKLPVANKREPKNDTAQKNTKMVYAKFSKRVVSYFIDTLIACSIYFTCFFGLMSLMNVKISDAKNPDSFEVEGLALISMLMSLTYFFGMYLLNDGQTLGKIFAKTRLVSEDGNPVTFFQLCKRYLAISLGYFAIDVLISILSIILLAINPLMVLFGVILKGVFSFGFLIFFFWGFTVLPQKDPLRRAIHDKIAGTVVIEE